MNKLLTFIFSLLIINHIKSQDSLILNTNIGVSFDDLIVCNSSEKRVKYTFENNKGVSNLNDINWGIFQNTVSEIKDKVTCIHITTQGKLWFGSDGGGVTKYGEPNWINYTTEDGLCSNYVTSIDSDVKGNVWVGGDKGLSKYDGKNWTKIYMDSNGPSFIESISIDVSGNKWVIPLFGSLAKFNDTIWTRYINFNDYFYSHDMFYSINCISNDPKGNIWIGSSFGVTRYDGIKFTHYTKKGLSSGVIAMSIVSENYILVGTDEGKLLKFDGKKWRKFCRFKQSKISCINIDGEGNKWIGTYGNGIFIWDGIDWIKKNTTNCNLQSDFINCIEFCIIDNQNKCFIGTDLGVTVFDLD
jgi:ligand-binding sensor domain-containing protein